MQKTPQKFFLAANSGEGFRSFFAESYIPGDWRAYIIKGGPGTGKSSFMKFMAARALDKGYKVILCPCSSDPDSLDGVIIEDIKTVFLDGTAPHVVEPRLPGACESLIDLGQFWDSDKLFKNAEKISAAALENSRLHKTAAAYLSAAGEVMYDNLKISRLYTDRAAVLKFALKLSKKHLPEKKAASGEEFVRFIGGVTPKGVIGFSKSVTEHYKNIVVIEDKLGGAAGEIMKCLRASAKEKGYDIITLKSPFLPDAITDHILIPELSLAFVSENDYIKFDTDARRIHARRFTKKSIQRKYRGRILFNRKVSKQLLLGAAATLKSAKDSHDILEEYYIEAMDFPAVSRYAFETAERIIK
ncbi:MAG: hypothetical protein J5662_05870 [Clostridia bacterium]|nr:hypothetical protein [Clostridia bacterium]